MEEQFTPAMGATEPYKVLNQDGGLVKPNQPTLDLDRVEEALRLMILTRRFDERAFRLQRQGRFGTFSQVSGQEAAIVGSAFALDPSKDWVVPQYRELPALLNQGYPLENFILYFTGDPRGGGVPEGVNCLPLNIALASQLPHAAGLAWGLKRSGSDGVVTAYFGDGASSEGDTHESLNLAGIQKAPAVFLLSNNGWAISTPREKQSAAQSLASRAIGYGVHGVVVDGNDLLAVHEVTQQAVQRARNGDGPTLIEAVTYRVAPHNTADDPSRYVDEEVIQEWRGKDPLDRVRAYLRLHDRWSDAAEESAVEQADEQVQQAFDAAAAISPSSADLLFEHLYDDAPHRVHRQQEQLAQGRSAL